MIWFSKKNFCAKTFIQNFHDRKILPIDGIFNCLTWIIVGGSLSSFHCAISHPFSQSAWTAWVSVFPNLLVPFCGRKGRGGSLFLGLEECFVSIPTFENHVILMRYGTACIRIFAKKYYALSIPWTVMIVKLKHGIIECFRKNKPNRAY